MADLSGQDVDKLHNILLKIYTELNDVCPANFNEKMPQIQLLEKEMLQRRELLSRQYLPDELKLHEIKLTNITKLISEKYDNLITAYKNDLQIIKQKLKSLQNEKKIANYSRYTNENRIVK